MDALLQDVRYACRALSKNPAFTAVAVIALALGIGANSAIFAAVNAVVFRQLPYPEPERLVQVVSSDPSQDLPIFLLSGNELLEYRSQSQVFENMAAFRNRQVDFRGGYEPVTVPGATVSSGLFQVLGYEPILGRTIRPEDENLAGRFVTVISHGFWQRHLGGDPEVLGTLLAMNRRSYEVIGVMPPEFRHVEGENAQVFFPVSLDSQEVLLARWLTVIARLRPGVTMEQAQAEMSIIASRLEQKYPDRNTGWTTRVMPLRPQFVGDTSQRLYVMLGAVFFVLLIACANVANLLLSRAVAREREIAVRAALGAGRARLIRQLLTESGILAVAGGVVGLALAAWAMKAFTPLLPGNVPGLEAIRFDARILLFTLGMTLLTSVIVGVAPALHACKLNITGSLTDPSRGPIGGGGRQTLRGLLVVSEVALAMVLLVGAGLLMRSFLKMQAVDMGFQSENVLTMRVRPSWARFDGRPDPAFYAQLFARLDRIPGVASVGGSSRLPMTGRSGGWPVRSEEAMDRSRELEFESGLKLVGGNYFRAMGIPLLKGRGLTEQDTDETVSVAVINDTMARLLWPTMDPLGRIVVSRRLSMQVVGVVGDVKDSLEGEAEPLLYVPYRQLLGELQPAMLAIRTSGDPLSLVETVRREASALDSGMIINNITTLDQIKDSFVSPQWVAMLFLGAFAGVALIMAAAGIYGVMSYSVSQRTQEIGVRNALGAHASDLVTMVIRQGLKMVAAGLVVGLVASIALTRILESQLWGVTATDPLTIVGVALVLTAVALVACYVPARRATRVDPVVALRYE